MLIFLYLLKLAVFHDPLSPVNPTGRKVLEGVLGRETGFFSASGLSRALDLSSVILNESTVINIAD